MSKKTLYIATYPQLINPSLIEFTKFIRQKDWHCFLKPWQEIDPHTLTEGTIILPLAVWDYSDFPEQYQHWLSQLEQAGGIIFNSRQLQLWNMEKTYLSDFQSTNYQVSKNIFLFPNESEEEWEQKIKSCPWENPVCKPLIGQSGKGVRRLTQDMPNKKEYSHGVVLQPFIVSQYEICFLFIDGVFSHAIGRYPAENEWRMNSRYGTTVKLISNAADLYDLSSIQQDLWRLPMIKEENPLYVRADALVSDNGELIFNEIELIEPSLYLDFYPLAQEKILQGIEKRIAKIK